jgi:hypothetical protein
VVLKATVRVDREASGGIGTSVTLELCSLAWYRLDHRI